MTGLRWAVTFLTRIPVGNAGGPGDAGGSSRWFPVVGAAIGVVVGATYALVAQVLPSVIAGLIAVLVGVLITGGLHEDGLGDTADAFGGGLDQAEVARILEDPRQGTFGVIAIAGGLLLRAGAIGSMSAVDGLSMAIAAHSIGRLAVVLAMRFQHSVGGGLGERYARTVTTNDVLVALAAGLGIGAVASGIWVIASLALALAAAWVIGRIARKKLGGSSGDVLGTIEQAAEAAILVLGAAIAQESWVRPAWWL